MDFSSKPDSTGVFLNCHNCGYSEKFEPKTPEDALVLETHFRTGSSAGGAASGITVNEYTLRDPTLPHVHNLICPKADCPSNRDATLRDVIYIKTDPKNLKFQYICNVCKTTQWTN
jgi:hypothetical protein